MSFSKSFPRTIKNSTYPVWEEIYLSDNEEKRVEADSKEENLSLMKECIQDAKKLISDESLKDYQTDVINVAISLFEKRSSHTVFKKDQKAKEKFDEKYGPEGI
ncbi:MAG: hypothetical protein KKH88_00090 [Nanoarchaeota archaeon]|nr:hypothetical protein [Nanoarchaeota archaeon]MBU1444921.1 hypothetical protein [Nanoarchaeota archaeon]MBU2406713.1 hypothetical protein [Nanoarchaeota archaeon]MBU2420585.1 hypothetical protein [Nanoarchaeota archaeon]MBU2475590.1 hypothetical protein [Nanoarchaeota archaeon]